MPLHCSQWLNIQEITYRQQVQYCTYVDTNITKVQLIKDKPFSCFTQERWHFLLDHYSFGVAVGSICIYMYHVCVHLPTCPC